MFIIFYGKCYIYFHLILFKLSFYMTYKMYETSCLCFTSIVDQIKLHKNKIVIFSDFS